MICFSLPFLATNFLQALYGVADMIVVGRVVGPAGVSAIQVGGQVISLITNVAMGLAVAATVLVAQSIGAGKQEEQNKVVGTMTVLFLLLSIAVTALLLLFKNGILRLLNTPEEVMQEAGRYLWISAAGIGLFFCFWRAPHRRGASWYLGDAKRPLGFVAISAALNIALDLLFVWGMGMGAWGAGRLNRQRRREPAFYWQQSIVKRQKYLTSILIPSEWIGILSVWCFEWGCRQRNPVRGDRAIRFWRSPGRPTTLPAWPGSIRAGHRHANQFVRYPALHGLVFSDHRNGGAESGGGQAGACRPRVLARLGHCLWFFSADFCCCQLVARGSDPAFFKYGGTGWKYAGRGAMHGPRHSLSAPDQF